MKKEQNVLERVYEPRRLLEAWRQVKSNAGAAGVDQMTVAEFERRKQELFPVIRNKLIAGTYRFKPARRVQIPKKGSPGKFRNLGIPVVMDRIVAQSIHATLDEIYDPGFTQSNFGFRKGRSQHQAIRHVREKVKQRYRWCASVDLKSYFDEIPHDLIFKLIRRRIADERLVTLIARALKAGVVVEGQFEKTTKGVPQGSPLSPILSNIVLNEMDQELDRRGLNYARWADDFVILLKSKRSAYRVMERITRYLEETLGLPVNREKSEVALMREVTFLGFRIFRHRIRVSDQSIAKFKRRIHELTHRNNPKSMKTIIEELNRYLRGWANYFRIQEFKTLFGSLDDWVRGRLRSMQLAKWKKPKKFQRAMINAGVPVWRARRVWVAMRSWQSANRREVLRVLNADWFRSLGLVFLHDFSAASTS
jgi:group II intron reverse transcriptase/maturase